MALRLTLLLQLALGLGNVVSAWAFSQSPVARRRRTYAVVINSQVQQQLADTTQNCWVRVNNDEPRVQNHDLVSMTTSTHRNCKPLQALLAVVLSATLLFGVAPPAGAATDVVRGQELFDMTCAGCHQGGQNFVSETKTLQQDTLQRNLGGTDAATIERFVLNSNQHKNLVFFRLKTNSGKLTPEEYADVFAFVSDQAQKNKW